MGPISSATYFAPEFLAQAIALHADIFINCSTSEVYSMDSSKELAAGTYYLGVTCAIPNKYDTEYSVNLGMLA